MGTIEQFVSKEKNSLAPLLIVLYFVVAIVLCVGLFKLAGNIVFIPAPFLLIAAFLAAKYTNMMSKVEHEYSISTGVINIDRILNQTKRVPIVNTQVSEIQNFGRLSDPEFASLKKTARKTVYCGKSDSDPGSFYFACPYQSKGTYLFVFDPNEQILRTMSALNPVVARGNHR